MSDWNPSLYLHFAAERSRPAVELLARVPLENIEYIADLGCGPGNITALLHQRSDAGRAISPPGERTDIAGISASVYCCPPYGVIITSAGNGDREEFSLEFLLHHSSVTGQFQ